MRARMENDDLSLEQLVQVSAWVKFLFILTGAAGFGLTFAGILLLYA
jgi:hypothetical protein